MLLSYEEEDLINHYHLPIVGRWERESACAVERYA